MTYDDHICSITSFEELLRTYPQLLIELTDFLPGPRTIFSHMQDFHKELGTKLMISDGVDSEQMYGWLEYDAPFEYGKPCKLVLAMQLAPAIVKIHKKIKAEQVVTPQVVSNTVVDLPKVKSTANLRIVK